MIEIAAAVSIASSAYNGIRRAMDAGKEAQEIIGVFSKFFDAKEDILAASAAHKQGSKVKKLFSGSSVEAQALEITAAKHKTIQMEKELREYLMWTGQGAFYEDMMQTRRAIREAKLREARRIASRNAFIIDLVLGGLMATVGISAIIGMLVIVV